MKPTTGICRVICEILRRNQILRRFVTHSLIFPRLIKIPSSFEAWTLTWLIVISMFIGMVTVTYFYIRRKMKRKYLLAKIERRRSRRSSEESARNSQQADAFKVT